MRVISLVLFTRSFVCNMLILWVPRWCILTGQRGTNTDLVLNLSVIVRHIIGMIQKQKACLLLCKQITVSRSIRKNQKIRFHLGRSRRGRPRMTAAISDTYVRECSHLTARTVLIEWQLILSSVVSVPQFARDIQKFNLMHKDEINRLNSCW